MPKLDRVVVIQRPLTTRDSFGAVVMGWAELDKVWAHKVATKGRERFSRGANRDVATRAATFTVRYRTDLSELMRIVDDGRRVWNIVGLAVVGNLQFHDVICQYAGERLP